MPVQGAAVKNVEAQWLERGVRQQRSCPGSDLLLQGGLLGSRALLEVTSVCTGLCRGSISCLLAGSLKRQSFRPKIEVPSWLVLWEQRGCAILGNYRPRAPECWDQGPGQERPEIIQSNLSHPTFCHAAPSPSLPSTGKTLLCFVNHPRGIPSYPRRLSGEQLLIVL